MTPRGSVPYLNRELSWLEFNGRVLGEALDTGNPLLERLRFFCIFHSNLDEFFMVRVASLLRRIQKNDRRRDPARLTPAKQLELVLARVRELLDVGSELYDEVLLPALAKENIRILRAEELNPDQESYLDEYFQREIYPILTPVAIDQDRPSPRLPGLVQILAVLLGEEKEDGAETKLAVVQIPGLVPGLCRLPHGDGIQVCWLSDVVRRGLAQLFAGYRVQEAAAFRLIRDSEVELDEDELDDYVRMLESELKKRRKAQPVCLEYEPRMTPLLRDRLQQVLGVDDALLLCMKGPLETRPLQSLVDMPGYNKLRYTQQPPVIPAVFKQERGIFDIIRDQDILLHHPYDAFDPVVALLQTAAEDPDVLAIKMTLYRTSGKDSPLVNALIRGAESGKQVTVLIELTARFDEERNISWAKDLEDAGAHVLYGVAGLKVHAKITLVVRREPEGIRRYVHLGTGNYNERTARLYTDTGLLTAAEDIGMDASGFFNTITGYSEPPTFNRLVMAPLGLREKIISLIRREADWARSGQVSGILAKMNSLVDPLIIHELCAASQAGVHVQLNVRGICCLRPGLPGLSENIRVVSLVDRYLEHSRVFVVRNGGNSEVYLSSADWMPRNLDRRVELMFPVVQEGARERVIQILEAQLADNQKASSLKPDGRYERISAARSEAFRVQEALYRRTLEERDRLQSVAPVRFVPLENKE